jgi:insertion element IS1 protein InsB
MVHCKKCLSEKVAKGGFVRGKRRYICKECNYHFVEGDQRTDDKIIAKKALCVLFYTLGKGSFRMLAKIFNTQPSLVYRWIVEAGAKLPDTEVSGEIQEMEFDEMWHFVGSKKNKLWILKALDRSTRRVVAWVLGHRDTATFRRLYSKVKHLKNCIFYTDDWDAFSKVLPKKRHVIGKSHTVSIEQNNSNTRHHLGRFTRRTKVVSKKTAMVDLTLKLWHALTTEDIFTAFQKTALLIFR